MTTSQVRLLCVYNVLATRRPSLHLHECRHESSRCRLTKFMRNSIVEPVCLQYLLEHSTLIVQSISTNFSHKTYPSPLRAHYQNRKLIQTINFPFFRNRIDPIKLNARNPRALSSSSSSPEHPFFFDFFARHVSPMAYCAGRTSFETGKNLPIYAASRCHRKHMDAVRRGRIKWKFFLLVPHTLTHKKKEFCAGAGKNIESVAAPSISCQRTRKPATKKVAFKALHDEVMVLFFNHPLAVPSPFLHRKSPRAAVKGNLGAILLFFLPTPLSHLFFKRGKTPPHAAFTNYNQARIAGTQPPGGYWSLMMLQILSAAAGSVSVCASWTVECSVVRIYCGGWKF